MTNEDKELILWLDRAKEVAKAQRRHEIRSIIATLQAAIGFSKTNEMCDVVSVFREEYLVVDYSEFYTAAAELED